MRHLSVAAAAVLLSCSAMPASRGGQPPSDGDRWTVIEVAHTKTSLHGSRPEKASMDVENWLAIEFENQGNDPVKVEFGHYAIERWCFSQSGRGQVSGGMASGSLDFVLPQGKYTISEGPSDYSAAILGLPPRQRMGR